MVTDGGMGVLVSSAVPRLRCPEEANIRSPESVVSLHTSFIQAGADHVNSNRSLAEGEGEILDAIVRMMGLGS